MKIRSTSSVAPPHAGKTAKKSAGEANVFARLVDARLTGPAGAAEGVEAVAQTAGGDAREHAGRQALGEAIALLDDALEELQQGGEIRDDTLQRLERARAGLRASLPDADDAEAILAAERARLRHLNRP